MSGRKRSDLALGTLVPASLASVAATFLLARVGLTGTLLGAALIPIIITVVRELTRVPTGHVEAVTRRSVRRPPQAESSQPTVPDDEPQSSAATTPWSSRFGFLSWRRVLLTGTAAFAITLAVFTIPELVLGESVTDDRRTTFFTPSSSEPSDPDEKKEQPAPAETGEDEAPAETEAPPEPEPAPAPPEGEDSPQPTEEPSS